MQYYAVTTLAVTAPPITSFTQSGSRAESSGKTKVESETDFKSGRFKCAIFRDEGSSVREIMQNYRRTNKMQP